MAEIIGVKIPNHKQIDYCKLDKQKFQKNDKVVIEIKDSKYLAQVVTDTKKIIDDEVSKHLNSVIRKATNKDEETFKENLLKADDAYQIAKRQIKNHNLPMKLINSEYSLDREKLLFNFTSESRVDFRNLVKDLARIFHTRIELRQIGARDESKYLGGLGHCGRPLCCNSFLGSFMPVSIKMAKNQDLALNPSKLSGLCGRLMCCLKYEDDYYQSVKEKLPDIYSYVETPDGFGEVTGLNLLKCQVLVKLDGYETSISYDSNEIRLVD